jgi:hypothetical protein
MTGKVGDPERRRVTRAARIKVGGRIVCGRSLPVSSPRSTHDRFGATFPAWPHLRPHFGPTRSHRYEHLRPEKTPLHKIVSEILESQLAWRDRAVRPVPPFVEEEVRGYLECGILFFGFARALCTGCRRGVGVGVVL